MCINWRVEAKGVERFPFTCALIQDPADDAKYNLNCEQKGVCYDGQNQG